VLRWFFGHILRITRQLYDQLRVHIPLIHIPALPLCARHFLGFLIFRVSCTTCATVFRTSTSKACIASSVRNWRAAAPLHLLHLLRQCLPPLPLLLQQHPYLRRNLLMPMRRRRRRLLPLLLLLQPLPLLRNPFQSRPLRLSGPRRVSLRAQQQWAMKTRLRSESPVASAAGQRPCGTRHCVYLSLVVIL
jgi:hypothetical protein